MTRFVLLWLMLSASALAQADKLYRWVDAQGQVHYGDVPPAQAVQVEIKKIAPPVVNDEQGVPYETRLAQQNFPVTLFTSEDCSEYCDQARDLLLKRGIPFTEKILVTKVEVGAFKDASGSNQVPTLQLAKRYVNGFLAKKWHKELDAAGYPETSNYRQPVVASDDKGSGITEPDAVKASSENTD